MSQDAAEFETCRDPTLGLVMATVGLSRTPTGEATGTKLYLQLKSGDSYLRERKSDGAEIFIIKDERHARYWMAQAFPVLLVIRNSEGEVRWMEVRDWLKRASDNSKKPVKQIVFEGERFDVMNVRRWRDKVLDAAGRRDHGGAS